MARFAHMIVLAAFLALGVGTPLTFAAEPSPTEQKDKKDTNSGKAEDDSKKDEKKGMGGKSSLPGGAQPGCAPSIRSSSHLPTTSRLDCPPRTVHHTTQALM